MAKTGKPSVSILTTVRQTEGILGLVDDKPLARGVLAICRAKNLEGTRYLTPLGGCLLGSFAGLINPTLCNEWLKAFDAANIALDAPALRALPSSKELVKEITGLSYTPDYDDLDFWLVTTEADYRNWKMSLILEAWLNGQDATQLLLEGTGSYTPKPKRGSKKPTLALPSNPFAKE